MKYAIRPGEAAVRNAPVGFAASTASRKWRKSARSAASSFGAIGPRQTGRFDITCRRVAAHSGNSLTSGPAPRGVGGEGKPRGAGPEVREFPEWAARRRQVMSKRPVCRGPIAPKDDAALRADLRHFRDAVEAAKPTGAFLTAASPGLIAYFMQDEYYGDHAAYLEAIAQAMRPEYEAIVAAGFDLQLDCPDLALSRHLGYAADSDDEWIRKCELAVDALNAATARIPADRMRMHICWGNYEGPHHHDVPLERILPIVLRARPAKLSFEGANPRHEHEWEVFASIPLPDEKMILPGV